MFKLLRFFSIFSFISIVVTAVLLTLFYRELTRRETIYLAQSNNLALARTALISVRPELENYLEVADRLGSEAYAARRLASRLNDVLTEMMRDTLVVKVKLYDKHGVVIFSTDLAQIGENQANNTGFMAAARGGIDTELRYRGTTKEHDGDAEKAHRLETYVPVRYSRTGAVDAVFEIYTDANPVLARSDEAMSAILAGVGVTLLLLYAVLIVVVRRAKNIIESQQRAVEQRAQALEALSAQMLASEEKEKKRLAFGLHEGLGQTLSAIKLCLEDNLRQISSSQPAGGTLAAVVPMLREAIRDVQAIATELRPASLDELGLLPTIEWFCREFERSHPGMHIQRRFALDEEDVPQTVKILVYRVMESALRSIGQEGYANAIRLALLFRGDAITLEIEDASEAAEKPAMMADTNLSLQLAEARERTTLSGGTFCCGLNDAGRIHLQASWPA